MINNNVFFLVKNFVKLTYYYFFSLAEKDRRLKAEMEARRKEEEKHNEQLEADRRAARTLQEKLNEENRMLREQIGKNLMYKN